MRVSYVLAGLLAVVVAGCASDDPSVPGQPSTALSVQCNRAATVCQRITVAGDPVASTTTFQGYADATLVRDPRTATRFWMAYTYLAGKLATGANGQPVGVPHTATHLAESVDGGASWTRRAVLWDAPLAADPEGRGPASYFGSETPSLVATAEGTSVRWFSARLSYFLEAASVYQPRYASSWVVRVATATGDTPAALTGASEAVLGLRTTLPAYGVTTRLDALSSSLGTCGFWNNPSLALEGGRLVLLTECMEFDGSQVSDARSRVVVFSTVPSGAPATWSWRYDGVLADRAVATALGAARVVSANVSRTEAGRPMLLLSLHSGSGVVNQGCAGIELVSLVPPVLQRRDGQLVVLARVGNEADPSWYTGSCGHEPGSTTGIVAASAVNSAGLQSDLRATRLRP